MVDKGPVSHRFPAIAVLASSEEIAGNYDALAFETTGGIRARHITNMGESKESAINAGGKGHTFSPFFYQSLFLLQ